MSIYLAIVKFSTFHLWILLHLPQTEEYKIYVAKFDGVNLQNLV